MSLFQYRYDSRLNEGFLSFPCRRNDTDRNVRSNTKPDVEESNDWCFFFFFFFRDFVTSDVSRGNDRYQFDSVSHKTERARRHRNDRELNFINGIVYHARSSNRHFLHNCTYNCPLTQYTYLLPLARILTNFKTYDTTFHGIVSM